MCWIFECFQKKKKNHTLKLVHSNDKNFYTPSKDNCYAPIPPQTPPCKCTDTDTRIHLSNDSNILDIRLWDCMNIEILNCPKISRIPCIANFHMLETLRIRHCDIKKFNYELPECLRVLEINYCGLIEFSTYHMPSRLAEVDLSFNKLKMIPKCLETIRHSSINLKNNDFWFNMYSDISPGLICGQAVDELILAHKMNLLSTSTILYAISVLFDKSYTNDARRLKAATRVEFEIRKKEVKTTAENSQNVHLTSVQNSVANALTILNSKPNCIGMSIHQVGKILNMKDWDKVKVLCESNTIHSIYNVTYFDVLSRVLSVIVNSTDKDVMLEILQDELQDGLDTCLTGQITRMLNALNGFVKEIKISISSKEELANTIIALRKKYSVMYPDIEEYTNETIPVVWQFLEDMCVPEHEHMAWLEYI